MHTPQAYSWDIIEANLDTLQEVAGGYSRAHRGIITLSDGKKAFVKIGVDDTTKKWATKEVETYRILANRNYPYMPLLLAANAACTGFAIETLSTDDGWDWTDAWTEERLTTTLAAMDALADLVLNTGEQAYFATGTINETQDGWRQLAVNTDARRVLMHKLRLAGRETLATALNISDAANRSASFLFSQDTLVHSDVRADNTAWHPKSKHIKLVDWNWAQLGDRRIDTNALLANVHKAGFDVSKNHAAYLDKEALHWLAGSWLNASAQPLLPGAAEQPTLRDYQLSSGIAALDLAH